MTLSNNKLNDTPQKLPIVTIAETFNYDTVSATTLLCSHALLLQSQPTGKHIIINHCYNRSQLPFKTEVLCLVPLPGMGVGGFGDRGDSAARDLFTSKAEYQVYDRSRW